MRRILSFKAGILLFISVIFSNSCLIAQNYGASPVNWLYPEGNPEATKYMHIPSGSQAIDSFRVKWSTSSISGDVQPLIGNIINNPPLFKKAPYSPNEIAAIIGGKFVIVDASGKTRRITNAMPFLKGFSVMIDTNQKTISKNISSPVIMGVETIEFESKEKVGVAYLTGYDEEADTVRILQRLAIDLRSFPKNAFASIKPFFGKKFDNRLQVYATVNMSQPDEDNLMNDGKPYFRGLTVFNSNISIPNYPLPDIGDDTTSRFYLGPEVNGFQPTMSLYNNFGQNFEFLSLPCFSSQTLSLPVYSNNLLGSPTQGTDFLLLEFMTNEEIPKNISANIRIMSDQRVGTSGRPFIKPYYVRLHDQATGKEDLYMLIAEEYKGLDGSSGIPRLHLFNFMGEPLTNDTMPLNKPFPGYTNHQWSIAVGNVDGNENNYFDKYYPNNKGLEIIATHSTRDFAVPNSKLMILKYSSANIQKPTPPGSFLMNLDTIATQQINGWVAAVNDLDNASDRKDEIVLVDGSKLYILKLRDYITFDFRRGQPFDTLLALQFDHQTISNVAVADLEGDGLNDLVVTTFDSTYFIGTQILDILEVTDPIIVSPVPVDVCPGEPLTIKWHNIIRNSKTVNIEFREVINGRESDSSLVVATNVDNWADSLEYDYTPDKSLIGKEGYFYVVNNENRKIQDRTSLVKINYPSLRFDEFEKSEYFAGEDILFTGKALCVDSVYLEYGYKTGKTIKWTPWAFHDVSGKDTFNFTETAPCINDLYECEGLDSDSLLYIRTINRKYVLIDTSDYFTLKLRPAEFMVKYENPQDACPGKVFTWDATGFEFSCENVTIAMLNPESNTYTIFAEVPAAQGRYQWSPPLNVPDCVYLRFCCAGSCVRKDTLIDEFGLVKTKYINFVAPNPFNPPVHNTCDIVYKTPGEVKVNIYIVDQNNRLVNVIARGTDRQPGYAYCEKWDGRREDGSLADNGMYYVVIEYSNGEKEVLPVFIAK